MSQAPHTEQTAASFDRYQAGWAALSRLLREGKSFSGRERNCVFLNTGGGKFANASAPCGLDFPDDARALAVVDWDHDGDLDLWITNRTAPRLRLMRNELPTDASRGSFVSFRLQGVECNSDGIGARVMVGLSGTPQPPLQQTLTAGDAFLSQSSKWLHFAVPAGSQVDHVTVRWPHGAEEIFPGVRAGHRYLLKQSTGRAQRVAPRAQPTQLAVLPAETPPPVSTARTVLVSRPPLPLLTFRNFESEVSRTVHVDRRPLLLTFWSHSCASCLRELRDYAEQATELTAELDLLALSVDGLNDEAEIASAAARRLNLPFDTGVATSETIAKWQILARITLGRQGNFAVPLSLLIDRRGDLAVIYRGAVGVTEVLADVELLDLEKVELRKYAAPLSGRWTSEPRNLLLRPVAGVFRDAGFHADYDRLVQLEIDRLDQRRAAAGSNEEQASFDYQYSVECFNLARSLELQGDLAEARDYYRRGLEITPNQPLARFHLAETLFKLGESKLAATQLQEALAANPEHTAARLRLAEHYRKAGQTAEALSTVEVALEYAPDNAEVRFAAGATYARLGQAAAAVEQFQQATEFDSNFGEAWVNLAGLLAQQGQLQKALTAYRRAVDVSPGNSEARIGLGSVLIAIDKADEAEVELRKAVELAPDRRETRSALARALLATGQLAAAAEQLEALISQHPSDGNMMLRLAWLRATASDPAARNGAQAVQLSQKLNLASKGRNPLVLDTLAAAEAEAGNFVAAVDAARQALALVGDKRPPLAKQIESRLQLYQAEQPYREERR